MRRIRLPSRLSGHPPELPVLPSQSAYALWAAHYPPHAHNRLMELEQAALISLLPSLVGKHVLDLACGSGRYGVIARERGAALVVGTDDSTPMLRVGSGLRAAADLRSLPFAPEAFDCVICGLALGHLPPAALSAAFQEIARMLKPGGMALVSDFHPFLALTGGQRAFKADNGRTYAVEHHVHLVADYFEASEAAGLKLTGMLEPRTQLDNRPMVVPAALVLRFER